MIRILDRPGVLVITALLILSAAGVGVGGAQQTPTVSVESTSVEVDETSSIAVTIDPIPQGLRKYNLTVSVSDATVGEIQGASGGAVTGRSFDVVASSAESITFRVADFADEIKPGDGPVTLARIDVRGTAEGSTVLTVAVHQMTDENGTTITPSVNPGSLTVEASESSSDLGRFDANGNNQIDFGEVLDAIAAFNEGEQVGGQSVSFSDVLDVIAAFNDGETV